MSERTSVASTVLVIEDDYSTIQMLKAALEPCSFIIITARQVQEGIEVARERKPDAIILDLYIAGMDGGQICRAIREFSHAPILVLSAMNKPGAVAQALDEGADDYLIKPISTGVLIAHLNNLIRRVHGEFVAFTGSGKPL